MKRICLIDFDNPYWYEDLPDDNNYDPDDQKGGKDYEADIQITEGEQKRS